MRLTLRTLLAYLDEILEPEDYAALQQKIEESEFAKSLVARSGSVTHQPTLGAPKTLGTGVARNANSVAEYLDNTMAPEQIQEFEKICLESDIHLAEVTSLHRILTKAMGEAANVDPISRERMYQLINATVNDTPAAATEPPNQAARPIEHTTDTAPAPAIANQDRPATSSAPMAGDDERPMPAAAPVVTPSAVPDRSSSRFWPIALTALFAAFLTAAFFAFVDKEFRALVLGGGVEEPVEVENTQPTLAPPPVIPTPESGNALPVVAPDGDVAMAPESDHTEPVTPPKMIDPITLEGADDSDTEGTSTPAAPASADGDHDDDVTSPPTDTVATPSATPQPEKADDSDTNQLALIERPIEPVPESDPGSETDTAPKPVMGRLLSQDQVLLGTPTSLDQLKRLAARDSISAGDKLVVLPAFRPMISLGAMTLELDGETMIELVGVDDQGVPELTLHFGRFVARSLSAPSAQLRLRMGDHVGLVSFEKADAALAVEVRPFRSAGTDPEEVPSMRAVTLWAAGGTVAWTSADGREEITAPAHRILTPYPNDPAKEATTVPSWLTSAEISPLDARAVPWIEEAITPHRSVKLSLTELANHKRTEIRRLATRCCAPIGFFDPLLAALNDPDSRPRWNLYVPELTRAVARGPATASLLRESLERLRGDAGFDLYRMLWGYNKTGLTKGGEALELVEYLDHKSLDFRVLSFWNLQQITGLGMSYRPEYTKVKRRKAIGRWRSKAEKGDVVPVTKASGG